MSASKGQQVGYRRVSTQIQTTDRQLDGVRLDREFCDEMSGKDTDRPGLRECLGYVRSGDCLHVHSIDRLARNLADLQRIIGELTAKGVKVRFHKEGLVFSGDDSPMAKLMLQMIGAVAEFERAIINERRKEGVAIAQRKGVKFGRPGKLTESQIQDLMAKIASGQNKKSVAAEFGISRPTLYDILKRHSG